MGNLITPVPYSNPYAQPWRLPNFETKRVPLRWTYAETFVVPAGTLITNQPIPINGGSDFELREIAFYVSTIPGGSSTVDGAVTARFKNSHGKRLSSDLLTIEEWEGPVPVSMICPRGTNILVDLQNTNLIADYSVQVILKGRELFEPLGINRCMPGFEPEQYIPFYDFYSVPPPGWHDEPFDYYFDLDIGSGERILIPLPMEYDADFYWRGTAGRIAAGAGLTMRFQDAFQNALSQNFVVSQNSIGDFPYARPMYPEVCLPAYSVPAVECIQTTGVATTLHLAMRGVKRFKD